MVYIYDFLLDYPGLRYFDVLKVYYIAWNKCGIKTRLLIGISLDFEIVIIKAY
jgi:hypothetical protein